MALTGEEKEQLLDRMKGRVFGELGFSDFFNLAENEVLKITSNTGKVYALALHNILGGVCDDCQGDVSRVVIEKAELVVL